MSCELCCLFAHSRSAPSVATRTVSNLRVCVLLLVLECSALVPLCPCPCALTRPCALTSWATARVRWRGLRGLRWFTFVHCALLRLTYLRTPADGTVAPSPGLVLARLVVYWCECLSDLRALILGVNDRGICVRFTNVESRCRTRRHRRLAWTIAHVARAY